MLGILSGTLFVVALILALSLQAVFRPQTPSKTLSASWTESSVQLSPQSDSRTFAQAYSAHGETSCPVLPEKFQTENTYGYVSPVKEASLPFNALGFHWDAEVPPDTHVAIEARTSQDDDTWTSWLPTREVDQFLGTGARDTDLLFSSGRFFQYRISVSHPPEAWVPVLDTVQVTFLDSTQGPSAEDAVAASGPLYRLAALIRPQPLARQAWGADETIRFNQGETVWPPQYAPVQKIVLHHTASSNDYTDSAAIVRAIYYYHTVTLGWGDIGYNFVIDAAGKVYEGRYGGSNVIGAHALNFNKGTLGVALIGTFSQVDPPAAALTAIDRFLVAKAVQYGIDPAGRSAFQGKDLPNIIGHRDVNSTSCPGDRLYELLPSLRGRAAAALPPLGQSWVSDATPKVLKPGQELTVEVQVLNSGTAPWDNRLSTPIRLGYHWYTPDGALYAAEPNLEKQTDLPQTVKSRESISVQATLRAPAQEGQYVLRWDMVQRGVTWFAEQGNLPLERVVLVAAWAGFPNEKLADLSNELLVLLPPDRLRTLPLSRLTRLSNTQLVELIPDIVQLFPNERVLSFSNDMLLRYLPDYRLKTFSLDRIRTFPLYVQQRLGLAPTPTPTPTPKAIATPIQSPTTTPRPTANPFVAATSTATPTASPTESPSPTATPTESPTPTPTPRNANSYSAYAGPTDTPTEVSADSPGGAVAP